MRLLQEASWDVVDLAAYWGVAESTVYTWISQARAADTAVNAEETTVAEDTSGAAAPESARSSRRSGPKWKAAVGELRRRWETRVGERGLDREQATALLTELAELAGDTTT